MEIINTEADFLRPPSEHLEWKAAVRAQILGEELLQLPVQVHWHQLAERYLQTA